jgi:hypothetical protein
MLQRFSLSSGDDPSSAYDLDHMAIDSVNCKIDGDHFMADLSAVASGYMTVAAVLAGFAFSGLILLLTVRMFPEAAPRLPNSYPAAVRALLAAFISLALVATDYAYLSGLKDSPGPSASHSVLYGQAFAIAAMQLVYATLLGGTSETRHASL